MSKCDNNKHFWPSLPCIDRARSEGSTEISQCNNCLAQKIIISWWTWETSEGTKHFSETIVEDPR